MRKEPTRLVVIERHTRIWRRGKDDAPHLHSDAPDRHDEVFLHSMSPFDVRTAIALEGANCASSAGGVLCVREAALAIRLPPPRCRLPSKHALVDAPCASRGAFVDEPFLGR